MANVTEVRRLYQSRNDGRTESRVYEVEFDANDWTLTQARVASDGTTSIPADGEALYSGSTQVVTSKVAEEVQEHRRLARVSVTYSVPDFSGAARPANAQFLGAKWNVTVEAQGSPYTEPITRDRYDKAFVNVVGDAIDPQPEKTYREDERFSLSFTTDYVDRYSCRVVRGKINADVVVLTVDNETDTFDIGTLQIEDIRYSRTLGDNGEKYYRVTIDFAYRPGGWKRKYPNMGLNMLDASNNVVPVKDDEGNPVSTPVYLSSDGKSILGPGDTVHLLEFDVEDESPFMSLLSGIVAS